MTQIYGSFIRDDSEPPTPRTVQSLMCQTNLALWVQRATHEAVHDRAAASKFCLKVSVRLIDYGVHIAILTYQDEKKVSSLASIDLGQSSR